jgi:hypothetical protein
MTLYKRKSKQEFKHPVNLRNEPYIIINIVLAGVIFLIFFYAGFFSPDTGNYPLVCIHEKLTGEQCVSCGLSHSFSLIIRGRISEAAERNIYGLRVFLFFVLQLMMRLAFSVFYFRYPDTRKHLILLDISGSTIIFLIVFLPFISRIF